MFGRTNGNQGQNGEDGSGRHHFPPQLKGCSRFLRSLLRLLAMSAVGSDGEDHRHADSIC